jgi:hypothetical protein
MDAPGIVPSFAKYACHRHLTWRVCE